MNVQEWQAPTNWQRLCCIDAHTAGEPLRIITSDLGTIPGDSMLAKRAHARKHLDQLRRVLMWEPRGHGDMYGCILTAAPTVDGDLGVLFLHNEGFSTMCGHGIIALVKVGLDCGLLTDKNPDEIKIDTPAGRVTARARLQDGIVTEVEFLNVPSFCLAADRQVQVEGLGLVRYDLAFGGAYYAFVAADSLALELQPENSPAVIAAGKAIKAAIQAEGDIEHPFPGEDLGFLYGVIFTAAAKGGRHSRHACVFADGELDRSPTGTGVSARAAILHAGGELDIGERIEIESILGTSFGVTVVDSQPELAPKTVITRVSGQAYITGRQEFLIDPQDPLRAGFFLGR